MRFSLNFVDMRRLAVIISAVLINLSVYAQTSGDSLFGDNPKVYLYEIFEEIGPSATRKTMQAFDEAAELKADLIILHLNTYGGLVSDADTIRTRILNSPIPVYAFIENNAASAGALISIACHKIFMKEGATIGAATVVTGDGAAAPDKYQSYMRSKMRATATARGRNPEVAEAMVDGDKVVPGLNDTGDVVTLTTDEAIKWGFCDGKYATIAEMLKGRGVTQYELVKQRITWMDKLIGFLISPAVSSVLILLILGGIYYELRTPGIGFPLLVSAVAALLYFAPLYLEGLAENWEILVFIAGLALLGVEIFVIPGFGIAGISGLVLIFGALVLSAVNNIVFDFTVSNPGEIRSALWRVIAGLFGFVLFAFLSTKYLFRSSPLLSRIALETALPASEKRDSTLLIGREVVCLTDLRPGGYVELDGKEEEAHSLEGYIPKGDRVQVKKVSGNLLFVERLQEPKA